MGACNVLDTNPPDQLSDDKAIKTPGGARAALAGAYNELQDGFYYGGTMTHFGDLSADNANETGTFTSYKDAAQHALFADNSDVTGMWNHIYDAIKRANTLIARVPGVTGFAAGRAGADPGRGVLPPGAQLPQPGEALRRRAAPARPDHQSQYVGQHHPRDGGRGLRPDPSAISIRPRS